MIAGAIGFVVVAGTLHLVQPGYDPKHQLTLLMGVGQRLAAACLLAWLAIVGVRAWKGMASTASGLAVPVLDEEHVRGPTA